MQLCSKRVHYHRVVFTLQTAGRCNFYLLSRIVKELFLPCKQQADATYYHTVKDWSELFLPCKQQADATETNIEEKLKSLFLPCKQQADATVK